MINNRLIKSKELDKIYKGLFLINQMNIKEKRGVIIIFFLVLLTGFISPLIEIGDTAYSIPQSFHTGGKLKGWINISLANEDSDIELRDSEGNSIIIGDVLGKGNYSYNCSPKDCGEGYESVSSSTNKIISLSKDDSIKLGFLFNEDLLNLDNISFRIRSDAPPACQNQLSVDFLSNNQDILVNYQTNEEECESLEDNGCYVNIPEKNKEYMLVRTPKKYCQRISFQPAPAYKVGSWFKGESIAEINFKIYDIEGNEIEGAECQIEEIYTTGVYSCLIEEFSLAQEKDYYLCLNTQAEEDNLSIRGYNWDQGCGFYWQEGEFPANETATYYMFSKGLKFDNPGDFSINKGDYELNEVEDYISEKYSDDLKCSGKQCIVPLKITSHVEQNIEIDNIYLRYTTAQGPVVQTRIHELEESPGKISFDFQKIQLIDTDFSLPDEKENITYRFYIGGEEIIEEEIKIGELPKIKEVSPSYTVSAYSTTFNAEISSEGSVLSYNWDFGDGNTLQTDYPNAEHIYNSTGTYELKLSINGIEGLIDEKKFNIKVNSAVNMTGQKIDSLQKKIEELKSDLNKLSGYDKIKLEDLLNLDEKESEIRSLQREYASAVTEKEYNAIAAKVQEFVLPDSIVKTRESEELVFYPLEENININAVAEISSQENISDEQEYIDGLMGWIVENMNISVSFREYVISDKGEPFDSLKIFRIKTTETNPMSTSPYLIIQKNDFELAQNYGEFEEGGYIYIKLERSENEFEFSTQEEINFAEIPIFVSPELSRIPIGEDNVTEPTESKGKWTFFILIIIFLMIAALVVYIVLQEWYKKKYEKYLFGSKNELYNLLVYIHNSKIKGLKDDEIEKKLGQAGWNSEQLRYAIRKYHGKRTGMIEIPIDKILRLFKKDDPRKKVVPGFNKDMPPIPKRGNLSHGPMNNMPPKKFTGFKRSIQGNFPKNNKENFDKNKQRDFPKKDPFGFHKKTKRP